MANRRGGAAEAEHRRPHRRPQPGEPAPRRGVRPEAPRAGQQRVRPLQGRTLTQRHTGRRLPYPGQSSLFASTIHKIEPVEDAVCHSDKTGSADYSAQHPFAVGTILLCCGEDSSICLCTGKEIAEIKKNPQIDILKEDNSIFFPSCVWAVWSSQPVSKKEEK